MTNLSFPTPLKCPKCKSCKIYVELHCDSCNFVEDVHTRSEKKCMPYNQVNYDYAKAEVQNKVLQMIEHYKQCSCCRNALRMNDKANTRGTMTDCKIVNCNDCSAFQAPVSEMKYCTPSRTKPTEMGKCCVDRSVSAIELKQCASNQRCNQKKRRFGCCGCLKPNPHEYKGQLTTDINFNNKYIKKKSPPCAAFKPVECTKVDRSTECNQCTIDKDVALCQFQSKRGYPRTCISKDDNYLFKEIPMQCPKHVNISNVYKNSCNREHKAVDCNFDTVIKQDELECTCSESELITDSEKKKKILMDIKITVNEAAKNIVQNKTTIEEQYKSKKCNRGTNCTLIAVDEFQKPTSLVEIQTQTLSDEIFKILKINTSEYGNTEPKVTNKEVLKIYTKSDCSVQTSIQHEKKIENSHLKNRTFQKCICCKCDTQVMKN